MKKTMILNEIPWPCIILFNISAISFGTDDDIATLTTSVEMESVAAIVAINATNGITVITRKKASCPGNILISGFIKSSNIFSINFLAFSMLSPFTCILPY